VSAAATSEIAAARERIDDVRREVSRVYVGSTRPVDTMLVALLARGHALLEGVPGVAKTASSSRPTCSRPTSRARRHRRHAGGGKVFELPQGPGLRERRPGRRDQPRPRQDAERAARGDAGAPVTIDGAPRDCREPFLVLATQNPIEQEGTYPLPEAQLDRFLTSRTICSSTPSPSPPSRATTPASPWARARAPRSAWSRRPRRTR
jgi:MoxR-like ATPase